MTSHWVSPSCRGERCRICRADATHKVSEEIFADDPGGPARHGDSAYICCEHYMAVFGPWTHEAGIQR